MPLTGALAGPLFGTDLDQHAGERPAAAVVDQIDQGPPAFAAVELTEPLEAAVDPGTRHRLLADVLAADQFHGGVRPPRQGGLEPLRVLALAADVDCRHPFTSSARRTSLRLA